MAKKTKSKTVSAVVKFTPLSVEKIYQLQTPYFTRHHKELSKSDAVNMLLEEIPQESVSKIITNQIQKP